MGFQILMAVEIQRRETAPNAGEGGAAFAKKGSLDQAESRTLQWSGCPWDRDLAVPGKGRRRGGKAGFLERGGESGT